MCPFENTYPMRGGLTQSNYVSFVNAVDSAMGKRLTKLKENISASGLVIVSTISPWTFAKETVDAVDAGVKHIEEVKLAGEATHIRHRYAKINIKVSTIKGAPKLDDTWILKNSHMDKGYQSRLFCMKLICY